MGKPTICIGENKDADQLRVNCEADQRLCFHYTDCIIPLLSKSKISSLYQSSVTVRFVSDLSRTGSILNDFMECVGVKFKNLEMTSFISDMLQKCVFLTLNWHHIQYMLITLCIYRLTLTFVVYI